MPDPRYEDLHLFPSNSFIVLTLTFTSLIHFEFIFLYGVRKGVQLHSSVWNYSLIPAPFAEKTILSPLKCFDAHIENQFAHKCVVGHQFLIRMSWNVVRGCDGIGQSRVQLEDTHVKP